MNAEPTPDWESTEASDLEGFLPTLSADPDTRQAPKIRSSDAEEPSLPEVDAKDLPREEELSDSSNTSDPPLTSDSSTISDPTSSSVSADLEAAVSLSLQATAPSENEGKSVPSRSESPATLEEDTVPLNRLNVDGN